MMGARSASPAVPMPLLDSNQEARPSFSSGEESADGKPTGLGGSKLQGGHYRRKKTNKAPRKRTFIANMTKMPTILSDALAASARGTGSAPGSNTGPPPYALPAPGPYGRPAGASPGGPPSLQQLSVMYPAAVYGTKQVPAGPAAGATMQLAHGRLQPVQQQQPVYYDPELAAALANFQPQPAHAHQNFVSTAFRAVTTTLDELPPSTFSRSICTGLDTQVPAPRAVATDAPAAAFGMAASAALTLTPAGSDTPSAAAAGSAPRPQAAAARNGGAAKGSSAAAPRPRSKQQQAKQAKAQAQRAASPKQQEMLQHQPTDESTRSSNTPFLAGLMGGLLPSAASFNGMAAQQQQQPRATLPGGDAAPQLPFFLQLGAAGWSKLPPPAMPLAQQDDDEQFCPTRALCHTAIAAGAYGAVYRASLLSDDALAAATASGGGPLALPRSALFAEVAVKCMRPGGAASADALRSFQVEAELLPSLSHPNVVPVYYANADPTAGPVCLVQELAPLGTLADYIHRRAASPASGPAAMQQLLIQQRIEWAVLSSLFASGRLSAGARQQLLAGMGGPADTPEVQARRRRVVLLSLLRDVAAALEYLASLPHPVVHRDVKPANVLISASGAAVLSDFGVARVVPAGAAAGSERARARSWDGSEGLSVPASKRVRVASSDGTSGWRGAAAVASPAGAAAATNGWSPASSEASAWMDALLGEDMPGDAMHGPSAAPAMASDDAAATAAATAAVENESLGWLSDLLDKGDELPAVVAAMVPSDVAAVQPDVQLWASEGEMLLDWPQEDSGAVADLTTAAVHPQLEHDLQGTAHYAAPEDLFPQPQRPVGPAADVFSLGYCIWEAMSTQRPWAGVRGAALAQSVGAGGARLPINRGWSLGLQGLMRRVWMAEPSARPAAGEVAGVLDAEICSLVIGTA